MRPNSISHQSIFSCLSNNADFISAISTFHLDEISIKSMVLFQTKNLFSGFSYDDTCKLATKAQACLISSIANTHNSTNMRSVPDNNQSTARMCDYLTQALEKQEKNYNAGYSYRLIDF